MQVQDSDGRTPPAQGKDSTFSGFRSKTLTVPARNCASSAGPLEKAPRVCKAICHRLPAAQALSAALLTMALHSREGLASRRHISSHCVKAAVAVQVSRAASSVNCLM